MMISMMRTPLLLLPSLSLMTKDGMSMTISGG